MRKIITFEAERGRYESPQIAANSSALRRHICITVGEVMRLPSQRMYLDAAVIVGRS